MERHELFGVRVDDVSPEELERCISDWLLGDRACVIVTPNPEFILSARHDAGFRDLLNRADLSLPDGVGLRFAIPAITGTRLSYRHTGVDTLETIARACAASGKRLALFGGDPGVAERAASRLRDRIPNLLAEGIDPGPVDPNHLNNLNHLNDFTAIAVGLGQGKQERVIESLRAFPPSRLPALRIAIGVGGAFDMISGTKRRAPSWMRAIGLEWLWRAVIEPGRIGRILRAFPGFPAVVVWDTLKHRRFLRACRASIPEILRQLRGL